MPPAQASSARTGGYKEEHDEPMDDQAEEGKGQGKRGRNQGDDDRNLRTRHTDEKGDEGQVSTTISQTQVYKEEEDSAEKPPYRTEDNAWTTGSWHDNTYSASQYDYRRPNRWQDRATAADPRNSCPSEEPGWATPNTCHRSEWNHGGYIEDRRFTRNYGRATGGWHDREWQGAEQAPHPDGGQALALRHPVEAQRRGEATPGDGEPLGHGWCKPLCDMTSSECKERHCGVLTSGWHY